MKKILMLLTILLLGFSVTAQATPYGFTVVENNSPYDLSGQLAVDVTANGTNALFTFTNTGSISSFITEIYFDWGTETTFPLTYAGFSATGDVEYTVSSKKNANLPGGQNISFVADWAADPTNPAPQKGINNYTGTGIQDSLTIDFSGSTFNQIISALNSEALRIGVHIQGLPQDKSETYVTEGNTPVPEPGTLVLLGAGLLGVAFLKRKRA